MPKARLSHWSLHPPIQRLIYFFARSVLMAAQMFPHEEARRLGRWIGWLLQRLGHRGTRFAVANLLRVPDVVPPAGIPRFLARVYEEIGITAVEVLMAPRLVARREIPRIVRLEKWEIIDRALAEGRGAIGIIGHQGNYELAGLAATLAGYPLNSLARTLVNGPVDAYLTRFRSLTGQRIIPRDGAMAEMLRVLRRNEVLIIQIDQDAKRSGVIVDFFGRPASTHPSAALLSLRCGSPIVPIRVCRDGAITRCIASEPIRPDEFRKGPEPVRTLTAHITKVLEGFIRERPEQWWWFIDRWRYGDRPE